MKTAGSALPSLLVFLVAACPSDANAATPMLASVAMATNSERSTTRPTTLSAIVWWFQSSDT